MPLNPSTQTGKTAALTVDNTAGGVPLATSAAKDAATFAVLTVHSQPIRYVKDAAVVTTAMGHYATDKDVIVLRDQQQIDNFRAIREGGTNATVSVSYFEGTPDEVDLAMLAAGLFAGTRQQLTSPIQGVAAGYKVARGEVTLDGGNPTPIVTGLASVVACTVALKAAATPGDDPTSFSVDYGGAVAAGTVNLYAYKTDGTDPTLVASTNAAAVVSWIAIGT